MESFKQFKNSTTSITRMILMESTILDVSLSDERCFTSKSTTTMTSCQLDRIHTPTMMFVGSLPSCWLMNTKCPHLQERACVGSRRQSTLKSGDAQTSPLLVLNRVTCVSCIPWSRLVEYFFGYSPE